MQSTLIYLRMVLLSLKELAQIFEGQGEVGLHNIGIHAFKGQAIVPMSWRVNFVYKIFNLCNIFYDDFKVKMCRLFIIS